MAHLQDDDWAVTPLSDDSAIAAHTVEPLMLHSNIGGTRKPSASSTTELKFCSAT